MEKKKKIYVVLSQTGSVVSKLIHIFSHRKYNHASLSLDDSLDKMYSFARKYTHCPFIGAFVTESKGKGTLKYFKNTECVVLEMNVSEETFDIISARVEEMLKNSDKYKYNYKGLFAGIIKKHYTVENKYYCSEFVKSVLEDSGAIEKGKISEIAYPHEFLSLDNIKVIYEGKLNDYEPVSKRKEKEFPLPQIFEKSFANHAFIPVQSEYEIVMSDADSEKIVSQGSLNLSRV